MVVITLFLFNQILAIDLGNLSEQDRIDKAYDCLNNLIGDCSSLGLESQIFSLLATGKCFDDVESQMDASGCFPKLRCNIKTTAQAMLALKKAGGSVEKTKQWLLSQKVIPNNLIWYIQVDSRNKTTCKISGRAFLINEDKKIVGDLGRCFSVSSNGYWIKISPSCYNQEFEITCDSDFTTNLLYQKENSPIIYIPEEVNSASAGGKTKEKINLFCLKQGSSCDYAGTLWAAYALDSLGEDIKPFLPYLKMEAKNNQKELPYSIIYSLTQDAEFRQELLNLQRVGKYWEVSGDRFFDTALALNSLFYDTLSEKDSAKEWLLEKQSPNGCWDNDVVNTAFILSSVWPRDFDNNEHTQLDCESEGYYCVSNSACSEAGGNTINYHCFYPLVCCDKQPAQDTCSDRGGLICNSNEVCTGDKITTSDLRSGEVCCLHGTCNPRIEVSECEQEGGVCRGVCRDDETETTYSCLDANDVCCKRVSVQPSPEKKSSKWWIYLLVILIILVVIGIIYRNKIKAWIYRRRFKQGKGVPMRRGPFPPPPGRRPPFPPQRISPGPRRPLP